MRKLLVRLGLGAAMLAGAIGVVGNTQPANALPLGIAGGLGDLCHDTVVLGTVSCLLQGDEEHFNYIVDFFYDHGVGVAHEQSGGTATGFDKTLLGGLLHIYGYELSSIDYRLLKVGAEGYDPYADDTRGGFVRIENVDGAPDSGWISLFDNVRGRSLDVYWENGSCGVYYDGSFVSPCSLRIVPRLPFIPNLPILP